MLVEKKKVSVLIISIGNRKKVAQKDRHEFRFLPCGYRTLKIITSIYNF